MQQTVENMQKKLGKLRNYGPTEEEQAEMKRVEEETRLKKETEERAERERREAEEAAERKRNQEEWVREKYSCFVEQIHSGTTF